MKIKEVIAILSKLNPEMEAMTEYEGSYDEFTDRNIYEYDYESFYPEHIKEKRILIG